MVDAQCVLPGVWLGSLLVAADGADLDALGITHIVSVCHRLETLYRPNEYKAVTIADDPDADLLSHFRYLTEWILELAARGAKVLVHCENGVSRSAAVVAACMIRLAPSRTPIEVQALLRAARDEVAINAGFMKQLWEWRRRQLFVQRKKTQSFVSHVCFLIFRCGPIARCISSY